MKASGTEGTVTVAGRIAAELSGWQLDTNPAGWMLEAKVSRTDEYWLGSPGPFVVRLPMAGRQWILRDAAVSAGGDELSASGTSRVEIR